MKRPSAKTRNVEAKIAQLRELRTSDAAELREPLTHAIADASDLVAAEAAGIAGDRGLADLAPDLVTAFDRFMADPETLDKHCRAMTAIVEALNKLDHEDDAVFLRGIRHVQTVGGYPKADDVAVTLRANSAFGLVRVRSPDVLLLLVDLLLDKEPRARSAAAQALGSLGSQAAVVLLRYKARLGDAEDEVTGACLSGLMTADPEKSLAFVAGFLRGAEAVAQDAALALGESRRSDALEVLTAAWPRARGSSLAEVLLLAIALTRLPVALDFLLTVLETDQTSALAVLSALAIHRHNDALKQRLAEVVARLGDRAVAEKFARKFS